MKDNIVKCTWNLCQWCEEVDKLKVGICNHPNGTEDLIKETKLTVDASNWMANCKAYSGKET